MFRNLQFYNLYAGLVICGPSSRMIGVVLYHMRVMQLKRKKKFWTTEGHGVYSQVIQPPSF